MRTLQKCTFALLLALAGLYGCQPGAEENPQPDLLAGGSSKTWQLTDAKRDGLTSPSKPCLAGNTFVFRSDDTFAFDEGAEKCSSTDPQTVNGRWELYNSTITMRENGSKTFLVLKLKSLSASKMVTEVDNNGGPVIEYTFVAK